MRIKQFTSEEALEMIWELLDMYLPEWAGQDEYLELCRKVDLDYYEWPDDLIDEWEIKERVKHYLDDDWLEAAKNMLTDIDLHNDYWIIDWNGRPRDIDQSDCEYLRDEIIKELEDMLDEEDMKKYQEWLKERWLDED